MLAFGDTALSRRSAARDKGNIKTHVVGLDAVERQDAAERQSAMIQCAADADDCYLASPTRRVMMFSP